MRYKGNSNARSLMLLGLMTVVLVAALIFSIRHDNITAGSFRLDDIALCADLDDNFGPIERNTEFESDTTQVCLWFEYSRARDGDVIAVSWQHEQVDIQLESFKLSHSRGARAFYLIKEDGTPLPPGQYTVSLLCNKKTKSTLFFSINKLQDSTSVVSEDI